MHLSAKPDTIVQLLEPCVAEFLEAEYLRDKAGVRDALFGHVPKGAKPKGPWGGGEGKIDMFALARLMIVGFIVLTVIYVCLSLYSRAVRRGKLRREWQEGAQEQTLEEFLDEGLEEYDNSLRRKMILSVYVIPVILVSLVIYLTNFA
ncbi:hypothetical protein [Sulfitobacter sp.]|uniref:hypothetical protein n=1 Tax=Sulfitobacter sp. TaxID=1903071 RepID=UPI003296ECCB